MTTITTDAAICADCREPEHLLDLVCQYDADGNYQGAVCRKCAALSKDAWRVGGPRTTETESLLQDIYTLAMAVTSKAISRRLTHEKCAAICELVQKARAELEKE